MHAEWQKHGHITLGEPSVAPKHLYELKPQIFETIKAQICIYHYFINQETGNEMDQ